MRMLFIAVAGVSLLLAACREPVANPDPNHTHADFAVWAGGTKLDFSNARYMSAPSSQAAHFVARANAHTGEEAEESALPDRKHLHLHDGNGHVIHRHKPGLTLGDFFGYIGLRMTASCLELDDFQFQKLSPDWVRDFAVTKNLCTNGKFRWSMIVNGSPQPFDAGYLFRDLDRILLSYGATDTNWQSQWEEMTSDACLYSQTCPWRGKPPAENCIADPEVPCVQ